jgi:hypothetical protein
MRDEKRAVKPTKDDNHICIKPAQESKEATEIMIVTLDGTDPKKS